MFSYAKSFDMFNEDNLTDFELVADVIASGMFTGSISEKSNGELTSQNISVIGNFDNGHIEFTKTYHEKNYSVYYKGDWNQEYSSFMGTWEIEHYTVEGGEMVVYQSQGIWAMHWGDKMK